MPGPRLVAVGRVGRPHGVQGEVRVEAGPGLVEGMGRYRRFYLSRGSAEEASPVAVEAWRPHGRFVLVVFQGARTPEQAAAFTGSILWVERSELPPLAEGEYYHADLLGCAVRDEGGNDLGKVVDVFATGAHDVLVIRGDGGEWMLPVTEENVPGMDLAAGELVVRVPEGLRG